MGKSVKGLLKNPLSRWVLYIVLGLSGGSMAWDNIVISLSHQALQDHPAIVPPSAVE